MQNWTTVNGWVHPGKFVFSLQVCFKRGEKLVGSRQLTAYLPMYIISACHASQPASQSFNVTATYVDTQQRDTIHFFPATAVVFSMFVIGFHTQPGVSSRVLRYILRSVHAAATAYLYIYPPPTMYVCKVHVCIPTLAWFVISNSYFLFRTFSKYYLSTSTSMHGIKIKKRIWAGFISGYRFA